MLFILYNIVSGNRKVTIPSADACHISDKDQILSYLVQVYYEAMEII